MDGAAKTFLVMVVLLEDGTMQVARVSAETLSGGSCSSSDAEILQFLENERTGPSVHRGLGWQ